VEKKKKKKNRRTPLYLLGFVLHRENKPKESTEIYTKEKAAATHTKQNHQPATT